MAGGTLLFECYKVVIRSLQDYNKAGISCEGIKTNMVFIRLKQCCNKACCEFPRKGWLLKASNGTHIPSYEVKKLCNCVM